MDTTDQRSTGDDESLQWRKNSFSASGGRLEVARVGRFVHVRDSEDTTGVVVMVPEHSWACFLSGVRIGDFDDL